MIHEKHFLKNRRILKYSIIGRVTVPTKWTVACFMVANRHDLRRYYLLFL